MTLQFNQIFENIIVSGDIHGDIMPLTFKITETLKLNNSLIIVAGDCGIGFYKDDYYLDILSRASYRLKKRNNILLFVRGNHDDASKWNDYLPFKEYWQTGNGNVRFVKDTVVNAETIYKKHNILCVGGAISVDRTNRTAGKDYWSNEVFVYDAEKIKDLRNITEVITHSCPDFCEPLLKGGIAEWIKVDPELEKDCNKERAEHTMLYETLKQNNKLRKWAHGHFHYSHRTYINDTQFCLLKIMEFVEL